MNPSQNPYNNIYPHSAPVQSPYQQNQINYQQPPQMQNPYFENPQQYQDYSNPPLSGVGSGRPGFASRVRACLNKKTEKKMIVSLIVSLILGITLTIFSTSFGFVMAMVPKWIAFVLGISSVKMAKDVHSHGIFFGFQTFSILFTFVMSLNGFYSLMIGAATIIAEITTLIFSGILVSKAKAANSASSEENNEEEIDIVEESQPMFQEIQQPQQTQPYQQPQQPQPSQPSQPVNYTSIYQAPAVQPNPQVNSLSNDEILFQKFSVQLNLLDEMNFERNYEQKVRNARLLEKYNGNIQQVVGDIVQDVQ